ncbi:acyl-CoA synthetase [Phytohabitans flavus]|uniref:Putative fatty-acid-CoA ligase FadD n=1 Tax=Phytohabitans flavus TaxID=1076124 RepID=A0A6F8XS27_9ACTN|nr:putative fatty-acid-CoA ligase FadD [Phytohabitans flavus]
MNENFATVLETVADQVGQRPAVIHGDQRRTWADLDERAARLAGHLAERGIGTGDRVAIALYNGFEYVESLLAVLKLRAVPVNVNYRYREAELRYLLENAQARAIIFDPSLAERVDAVRQQYPGLHTLLPLSAYEEAMAHPRLPRQERGDDEWQLYTGGTTGLPRGVVSRHSWLFAVCVQSSYAVLDRPVPHTLEELAEVTRRIRDEGPGQVCLAVAPLMHGAGIYNTLATLLGGGTVVFLTARSYDPAETARLLAEHKVTDMGMVGDVFARPLADELDRAAAAGTPYDLSHLRRLRSVGVMWSADVKRRLLEHGEFACYDTIAASEGGPFAMRVTRRGDPVTTARFVLAPGARLIGEDGEDVPPGSGSVGMLAAPTDEFIHYHGDEEATARTFRYVDGTRYCMPGDLATLEEDGTLVLRGRGSGVINTGGEKVFAEEVEQVLLRHPAIGDAVVVGVPHERWGSQVVAVVSTTAAVTADEVREFVGERLAGYKRPREVVFVPSIRRSPAGKADLRWVREVATSVPVVAVGPDGVRALAGKHLGYTPYHEVTQDRVNLFADATGDHQWIHVDPARAAAGPYGGTIAHGFLTLSLTTFFLPQLIRFQGFGMGVNYGCEKVRFPAPVPVGGQLRCGAAVDAVTDVPGGVQTTMTLTFEVQGQAKPSCVATIVVRQYEKVGP